MSKRIAFCGLDCGGCPAFLATQANDDGMRKETAWFWSKQFHAVIKPEDINCDGCHTTKGRSFLHCQVCEIRKCGRGKGIANCGYCPEYACERLTAVFEMLPQAKENLEEVRKGR